MTKSEGKLLPCPFCGSDKVMMHFHPLTNRHEDGYAYHAVCRIPECHGSILALADEFNSEELARNAWNTRTQQTDNQQALAKGAAAAKHLFDLASTPPDSGFTPEDVAEAVLDAVGVKYED